ncbi:sensor histidine kinase [Halanaerobium hydrogeniformans]|uniref:Signal transduction histidine kinase, LytS n=1 Tax=Halanaerobium hydrogeniformans TaxID=656519 RepID=E4RM93_HALHG|nr:PocR ligand-binding domain-containing protein [Halanaerobium hydrogeniformans]ADQ14424.1 signal transduction histidine kinase, LytS [Halanaerobium hydrogeniformans]
MIKIRYDYDLSEVINIDVLQSIQDKFAEATGLAAVIVDREGIPVTNCSRFTSFCKTIRYCEKGFQKCTLSDSQGGIRAKEEGKSAPYVCESGLIDMAAPIILENRFIGTILCGQIILEEDGREKTLQRVKERTKDIDIDFETIKRKFNDIEVLPKSRIVAATEFLSITANYIAEMGLANIYQQELLEESRSRRQLEEHLRTKKLQILQSQVNPHFLFNVLNSIARLSLIEGASETEDMVYALSDLLRYSLRNVEEVVKLEEELNCVKDYITIQKKRYKDKFDFDIDIDEDLLDINIPLLTIQPLLENSIIHGFKEKSTGKVKIKAEKMDNMISISVIDDGLGMKDNYTKELLSSAGKSKDKITSHITGIGINNVHQRLKHYFGEEYGLEIKSELNKGTEVKINLPGE